MSRWPGATEEPVPPRNNPTFHPRFTSTLHQHRPGGHTGLVKHREEQEEERWTTRCFSDFRFEQDLKLSVMLTESHQFKLGLPMKKINPAASSTEFREKSCMESATKSTMHASRDVSKFSVCQHVNVKQDLIHHLKRSFLFSLTIQRLELPEAELGKKNLFFLSCVAQELGKYSVCYVLVPNLYRSGKHTFTNSHTSHPHAYKSHPNTHRPIVKPQNRNNKPLKKHPGDSQFTAQSI